MFYTWDGEDGVRLGDALRIMANNPAIGLFLTGNPGNGKTTAARQFGRGAWFWDCNDADGRGQGFIMGEDRYVFTPGRDVIVDDLGAESEFREYGERREIMGEWLSGLYKRWKRGEWRRRLFVTSNLDGRALAARYGAALVDRLLEMCVAVRFTGRSRRVAANALPACATMEEAVRRMGWSGGVE